MNTRKEHNLTPQRRAVLDVVRQSTEHLTAREILEKAREILPRISNATVYNSLNYLTRVGLIHEIAMGDAASRYDRRDLDHGHAICEECGRVRDLDLPGVAPLVTEALRDVDFTPSVTMVMVYGRCGDCRGRHAVQ